jgi:hypothetical protein
MIMSKANVLTLALLMAKQAVERSVRDTGRKLRDLSLADRQRMAQAHLEANPGLVEDAERKLREWITRSR